MRRAFASVARPQYIEPDGAVDQLVIGAGVVGLAVARALSRLHDRSTFVIDRNDRAGQETRSVLEWESHARLLPGRPR